MFEGTNQERRKQGLPPLEPEPTLRRIAREHSSDMLTRGFFAHANPEGKSSADRIAHGHRRLIGISGENIWTGSGHELATPGEIRELALAIVEGWMDSPGHRENILRPGYTHLGVGMVRRGRETRATQLFAGVAAYTARAVPLQVGSQSSLDLKALEVDAPGTAEMYDFWPSSGGGDEALGPFPIDEAAARVPDGTYTLRFFFRESGTRRYLIYPGPQIEVK